MKLQYRIACVGEDYYPHVRIKKFLFWSKWKRIGRHPSGFGLYGELQEGHPLSGVNHCQITIREFDFWYKQQQGKVEYLDYDPNPDVNYTW